MEWGKLFANLPDDPRVQAAEASGGAAWLLVESMCYCTRAERGAFIPHTQVERFGGTKLKQKVAALVRERLWLAVDGGYLLNPDIWSEERNLSDSAEKKKKADRDRLAHRREAERRARETANSDTERSRDMSRDSRATDDATGRCDSRTVEKSREDKTFTAGVVSHLPVADARARDDDDESIISAVTEAARAETGATVTAPQAQSAIRVIRDRAVRSGVAIISPPGYYAAALRAEPDPWDLLGADAFAEAADAGAPAGTHAYVHDPETRACLACRGPRVDKSHARRMTA